jgi:hypothetical protein
MEPAVAHRADGRRNPGYDSLNVIASEAKQSILLLAATWIASLRSQ